MERKILTLDKFVSEQQVTNVSPESEREAKSRIAAGLVRSLFGGTGLDTIGREGGDSRIEITKEVKDSLPYKGCGATEPFKIERTPIGVGTFKILLTYLQSKGIGDYSRSIAALLDKRAVVIGLRNKLDVKKNPANQDRFIDALYFIPGNAKDGTEEQLLAKGKTGNTSKNEDSNFNQLYKKASKIQEEKGDGILPYEDFYKIYEEDLNEGWFGSAVDWVTGLFGYEGGEEKSKKSKKSKKVSKIQELPESTTPKPTGDKLTPYQITTVPSLAYYGNKPLNPKGTGIKMPGDTLYYLKEADLGHGTYKMMVEGEPIKVGRYPIGVTKYQTYKPADISKENCGMQIHRSSTKGVGVCIGPWSAGCQVFADAQEFKEFISKAEKETMNANKFIYALINLDDIPENVMKDAMEGNISKETAEDIISSSGLTSKKGEITSGPLAKVSKFVQS